MKAEKSRGNKFGEGRQDQVTFPEVDLREIQATAFFWTVFNQVYFPVPSLRISKNHLQNTPFLIRHRMM